MLTRLICAAMFCSRLLGQDSGVPVVIDGKEVVRVYSAVGSFSAKDRAPQIEQRLVALARKGYAGAIVTRAIPSENATAVVGGGVIIMAVTDLDADAVGVPRDELARRYASNLQAALAAYRVRHSWLSFLTAVVKTVVAWILFLISAWVLWKGNRWMRGRLDGWFSRLEEARSARGLHLVMWERGKLTLMTFVRIAISLFLFSEFSFLISYTFALFPQTAGVSTTLLDYLGSAFKTVGTRIYYYLPSGGVVVIVVVLAHYLLKILRFLARAIESGDISVKGIHPEMAKPTSQLMRLIVILFALVVVFPYLPGGNSEAFKGVSIFLGLLLSLGSSSAVSNVLAGLVLTYMRPFRAGDRVKIVDTVGDIVEKTLLVTRVRTIKNVEVVIPNAAILSNQILNYSVLARGPGLILNTTVTIGYDAPWRTVHGLLIRAALNTEGVLSDPAPFILQTSLNDFHISYELNAYSDRPNDIQNIYSHLHEAIQDSFNQAGVEIMSPTFYALRDGNTVTIPAGDRPSGYDAPSFRVKDTGAPRAAMPGRRASGY